MVLNECVQVGLHLLTPPMYLAEQLSCNKLLSYACADGPSTVLLEHYAH
jgi:hypothetical protein